VHQGEEKLRVDWHVKVLTQFGSHDSRAPSPTRPISLTRPLDEKTNLAIASTRTSTQPVSRQQDSSNP